MALPPQLPVGSVIIYAGNTVKDAHWKVCDGQLLSRQTYPELFEAIGTLYTPPGANAALFALPDLRGQFVRGTDQKHALGQRQKSANLKHSHAVEDKGHDHLPAHCYDKGRKAEVIGDDHDLGAKDISDITHRCTLFIWQGHNKAVDTHDQPLVKSSTTNVKVLDEGEEDCRPDNVALNYIIRVHP